MKAALLTGHGGLDRLEVRDDVPVPAPGPGEVLVEVAACGMNNTDINTRTGWYSEAVTGAMSAEAGKAGFAESRGDSGAWGGAVAFPRIQGADVAGRIAAVGAGVAEARVGERVMIDPWIRDPEAPDDIEKAGYLGSEFDGGFAGYTAVPVVNAIPIDSTLSDAELATFACAYSTGEHLLTKTQLGVGETVLITGASGGVGSAVVQLARRRGARTIAIAGRDKAETVRGLGADAVVPRETNDLSAAVAGHAPGGRVDVVIDVVGGPLFAQVVRLLRPGGRYASSGAIAGPTVELDLRLLIYRDLEFYGATVMPPEIFRNLVGYIERGEVRPLLARTFPLEEIRAAQTAFLEKAHVGNFVLLLR
jgi:NADPH:quinone reductase-like Zn-dependent oxidoreductase